MSFILQPWQLLPLILAGWINRQQQETIEYLRTENQILRESQGRKRIRLNDNQRRRLAIKGKVLGRKILGEIASIVTPDTILRRHRKLVAQKWDYSHRRTKVGRPPTSQGTVDLVLRIAHENPTWGYDYIEGALANLGHTISDTTVSNILIAHGIEPTPARRRQSTWKTFLRSHWEVIGAIDFTTIEVWTKRGLVTFYLVFAMELATRRVHFVGITTNPNGAWMKQIARNLTDSHDGSLLGTRYLLMDRDTKLCEAFRSLLDDSGVKPVRLPPRSPNMNGIAERCVLSARQDLLNTVIVLGERHLRRMLRDYIRFYHEDRCHLGLERDCPLIRPVSGRPDPKARIAALPRVGGLHHRYEWRAVA